MQGLWKANFAQRHRRTCRCSRVILVSQRLFTDQHVPLDNCKKYDLEKGGAKGKADDGECIWPQSLVLGLIRVDCLSKGQEAQR
jgi:hypothetical protein